MNLTLLIFYTALALGVSFLCSILEAVVLSIPNTQVAVWQKDGNRRGDLWSKLKADDAVKQTFLINRPSFQILITFSNGTSNTVSPIRFVKSIILACVLSNANLLFVNVRIPGPSLSSLQSSCLTLFSPSSMITFIEFLWL